MLFTLEKPVTPFLTVWKNTGSPPWYWTQTYQLPFTHNPARSLSKNAGLSVSYTDYQTPPQTTSAANLKLHTYSSSNPDGPPVSTSVNPRSSTLAPAAVLTLSLLFYCWGKSFRFISVFLSDAQPWAWRHYHLCKCRSVSPSVIVCLSLIIRLWNNA